LECQQWALAHMASSNQGRNLRRLTRHRNRRVPNAASQFWRPQTRILSTRPGFLTGSFRFVFCLIFPHGGFRGVRILCVWSRDLPGPKLRNCSNNRRLCALALPACLRQRGRGASSKRKYLILQKSPKYLSGKLSFFVAISVACGSLRHRVRYGASCSERL
jgi:hypothetical protein